MAKPFSQMTAAELLDTTSQMIDQIGGAPAAYHTTSAALTALTAQRDDLIAQISAKTAADSAAVAATAAKNASQASLEAAARSIRDGAKVGGTSDSDMAAAGMPVTATPLGDPASMPKVVVDTSKRLHHKLSWTDVATPHSTKRPFDAIGVEIWHKVGDPRPGNEKDCVFVAMDTTSPYVIQYEPADANKTVHYLVRWQLKNGSKSAFGDTASATVTA